MAVPQMRIDSCRRLTVDADNAMFPSSIAYYDRRLAHPQPLWWDMRLLHSWLRLRGLRYVAKCFFKRFASNMRGCGGGFENSYVYRTATSEPHDLGPICTTPSLLMYMFTEAARSLPPLSDNCASTLNVIAQRASLSIAGHSTIAFGVYVGAAPVTVFPNGRVHGFRFVTRSVDHGCSIKCIAQGWADMCAAGLLGGSADADEHDLNDIIVFLSSWMRFRSRSNRHLPSAIVRTWLKRVTRDFVLWLAVTLDYYTLVVYPTNHDVDKAPPSYRMNAHGKCRVRVNPDTVWDLLEQSRQTSASLHSIIQIRKGDASVGCNASRAQHWELLLQNMYQERTNLAWPHIDHLCLSVDSSGHAYNDVFVGLGYSHQLDQGVYAPLQYIVPGKNIYDFEDELAPSVGRLALQGKLARVSAYRQIQATSHMSFLLTGKTVDAYEVVSSI